MSRYFDWSKYPMRNGAEASWSLKIAREDHAAGLLCDAALRDIERVALDVQERQLGTIWERTVAERLSEQPESP